MADPTEAILRALKAGPFAVPSAAPGGGLPPAFPFKPPGTAQKWAQAPEVPKWQQAPLADGAGKGGKTVLNINGKRVSVSDNFLSMTPEEQNLAVDEIAGSMGMGSAATTSGGYSEAQLKEAARKALAAGDTAAAKRLVDAARKVGAASGAPASKMLRFEIQTPDGKTYEVEAPDQDAALAAVKSMEGAGKASKAENTVAIGADGVQAFTPEQRAALESAQARRKAQDAATSGMPFEVNPPVTPELPSATLIPGGIGAAGVRNPETGAMGGLGLFTPGRMTMEQARSELSETWKNPPAPISQSRAGVVSGAQAVTFGLADEIVGGILALHPRIDYDDARDYLRAEVDDAREYFPKTALASEVGASLLVPGGAAAKFINKGTSTLGRMARAGLAGGTSGAAYGFGSGEDGLEDRAWNALETGALGMVGGGALVGLGQGFNRGLRAISRRPELRELAPTLEGLRDEASRLYTEARESGALLPGSAVKDMVSGIQSKLRESGYDPDLHPRLRAVLNRLDGETGDKTLAEVEILRRVAGNAAESLAPDERRLAGQIIDKIDDTIAGIPEGGDVMKAARETWGRLRRMELIDTAMERASLAKADFSTALQSEFRALAKNARKLRGFSDAERAAIASIARGGPLTTGLQALGNALNPRSTLGALLTGGAAYATGPGALALPATSFATRKIAEALSRRAGQNVRDNVGRSDANRGLIEALMGRANPLASGVPATGLLASLLGRE